MIQEIVVTIDGPAGAGKSTVARRLAQRLGYRYLETGAMYRAMAWALCREGIRTLDDERISSLVEAVEITFDPTGRIRVNGEDVTERLRDPKIDQWSSLFSQLPAVRTVLTRRQRAIAQEGGVVLEGRDTGSVVMPEAEAKFYLDATLEERARRRLHDLEGRGVAPPLSALITELDERDRADRSRRVAPLVRPDDAQEIDSTTMSIEDVVEFMGKEVERIRCSTAS